MLPTCTPSHPFALLMDPQTVFRAMECSELLARLQSRICRPLDKPPIPHAPEDAITVDGIARSRRFRDE